MKTALITGGSGGIGSAFAKVLLRHGYHVLLPVRNLENEIVQKLINNPRVSATVCNVDNQDEVNRYVQSLVNGHTNIDLFILAAGRFKWDREFPGDSEEKRQAIAVKELTKANFFTKETVLKGLDTYFNGQQRHMTGIVIGSHAAGFGKNHPWRIGEEGYVVSMQRVSEETKKLQQEGRFKKLILEETQQVGTEAFKKNFSTNTSALDPETYAETVLKNNGLLA